MKIDYVNHMGDDLMVANAARVSFHKHKDEFDEESDTKLIRYLARHGHWTPFSHPTISLRVKAPIFVARQLFKHKVGMTENEVSRRYVDDTPEFFFPDVWRSRPTDGAKQGSSPEPVDMMLEVQDAWDEATYKIDLEEWYSGFLSESLDLYKKMIEAGVAPEQARMVLPQSMYTEWYWTGSLAAVARVCKLRLDPHAQKETQECAQMIDEIVRPLFPVSWEALVGPSN